MRDIKGFEGLYAVTSCGKVYSYKTKRFLRPCMAGRGYLRVNLVKDGKKFKKYVHRLVADAYIPNPEHKPQVNHKNENKTKNYVNNLEWCTNQENNSYGTKNERAKITRQMNKLKKPSKGA